jgi:hypothetical protein
MDLRDWHIWWKRRGGAGIRRILMDEWDPIGVKGIPEAADEYDSYGGGVARMLREGTTRDELAAYLTDIRENRMGLHSSSSGRERDAVVADRLLEWFGEEMQTAGG